MDLRQPGEYTDDLFAISQPAESTRVMAVLDQINERWGRGTLRSASVPGNSDWGIRREMMSQSYTSREPALASTWIDRKALYIFWKISSRQPPPDAYRRL